MKKQVKKQMKKQYMPAVIVCVLILLLAASRGWNSCGQEIHSYERSYGFE